MLVFPGGDYDSYRPTSAENFIDFNGRTGYVKTAIEARVPIVPVVSIGGQEDQFFLTRGTGWRGDWVSIGADRDSADQCWFSVRDVLIFPPNLPLPTKVVTQVLKPVRIARKFGKSPDVDEVDAHVRSVMQAELDGLARERRFPVLG